MGAVSLPVPLLVGRGLRAERALREEHERIEGDVVAAFGEFCETLQRGGLRLATLVGAAAGLRFEQRGLQLLAAAGGGIGQHFFERGARFLRRALLQAHLRGEQPIARRHRGHALAGEGLNGVRGAVGFAEEEGDGGFVAAILRGERRLFRQLIPELERLLLPGAGKETRDRAESGRLGGAELISGHGLFAGLAPILGFESDESLLGVTPRLPAFDGVARRPRAKEEREPERDDEGGGR